MTNKEIREIIEKEENKFYPLLLEYVLMRLGGQAITESEAGVLVEELHTIHVASKSKNFYYLALIATLSNNMNLPFYVTGGISSSYFAHLLKMPSDNTGKLKEKYKLTNKKLTKRRLPFTIWFSAKYARFAFFLVNILPDATNSLYHIYGDDNPLRRASVPSGLDVHEFFDVDDFDSPHDQPILMIKPGCSAVLKTLAFIDMRDDEVLTNKKPDCDEIPIEFID